MKRNDKREVKVAQLAGSVAEMSAYHHGEVSQLTVCHTCDTVHYGEDEHLVGWPEISVQHSSVN